MTETVIVFSIVALFSIYSLFADIVRILAAGSRRDRRRAVIAALGSFISLAISFTAIYLKWYTDVSTIVLLLMAGILILINNLLFWMYSRRGGALTP